MENEINESNLIWKKVIHHFVRNVISFIYLLFSTYVPVLLVVGFTVNSIFINHHENEKARIILGNYSIFIFLIYILIILAYRKRINPITEKTVKVGRIMGLEGLDMKRIGNGRAHVLFLLIFASILVSFTLNLYGYSSYSWIPNLAIFSSVILWFILWIRFLHKLTGDRDVNIFDILAIIGFLFGFLGGVYVNEYLFLLFALTWLIAGIMVRLKYEGTVIS